MKTSNLNLLFFVFILSLAASSCGKVTVSTSTSSSSDNQLYFVESYDKDKGEINKSERFSPGALTVVLNCQGKKQKLGVTEIEMKIENLSTHDIKTSVFPVNSEFDYVWFSNVNFPEPAKYKVTCSKPDGSVLASNEVEIAN
ncbi:hypothetical protein BH10BAC5_BH10BAC5_07340 [soil metagenome]